MWPLSGAVRAACLGALAGFVCGALLCGVGAWKWQASTIKDLKLEQADALVSAMLEADRVKQVAIDKIQGVNDARADELAGIAATAAGRPATVIRVCNPTVPAAPGGQGADAGHQPRPGAGVLPAGAGPDPGTDFDTSPLYELAAKADAVSADLRACEAAWPR